MCDSIKSRIICPCGAWNFCFNFFRVCWGSGCWQSMNFEYAENLFNIRTRIMALACVSLLV